MTEIQSQNSTAKYYSRLGSRLGYLLVMRRSQHFGFYDETHPTEDLAQENYHEKFASLLLLKSGMKVLDAGSGQGVVACYLAAHHDVHVTGITITPHEVQTANKRSQKLGLDNKASFMLADYASVPSPDNSFDRIYTTETLSHAEDVQKVTDEFMRLLKPGGLLVCAEYEMDYKNFDSKTKQLADFVKEHAAIHGIYQFGRGDFIANLSKSGFSKIHEIDWTSGMKPSFDRIRRIAKPIASLVRNSPFKNHFVNTLAAELYSNGVEKNVFAYKVYIARKAK